MRIRLIKTGRSPHIAYDVFKPTGMPIRLGKIVGIIAAGIATFESMPKAFRYRKYKASEENAIISAKTPRVKGKPR